MTSSNRLNLWMAATTVERDGLGTEDGVNLGDFCLVDGANLYVATTVGATTSVWRPMAGVPTFGPISVGGRNEADSAARTVFAYASAPFRAVLDATPSSITLFTLNSLNWPLANLTVVLHSTLGFFVFGSSSSIAANLTAWWRGTYTVNY